MEESKKKIYLPIGYFQLWHSSVRKNYEENLKDFMDDYLFFTWLVRFKLFGGRVKSKLIMNDGLNLIDLNRRNGRGHFVGIRNLKANNA